MITSLMMPVVGRGGVGSGLFALLDRPAGGPAIAIVGGCRLRSGRWARA